MTTAEALSERMARTEERQSASEKRIDSIASDLNQIKILIISVLCTSVGGLFVMLFNSLGHK